MARSEVTVVASILLLVATLAVVEGFGTLVGGRTEISDVKNNKEVQELGRFSVEEYNRTQVGGRRNKGMELVFSEVVEAQKQVVSGIKYFLKIQAMQNGLTRTFESVVVVKPWEHSKELLNFSPSSQ